MKKIILFVISLAVCMSSYAQTDIRTLDGKTSQALIKQLGTPLEEDHNYQNYSCADYLRYQHYDISLEKTKKNGQEGRTLDSFATNGSQFCFLSDIYPGGIKVGTKLSDLKKFDFINSKYGRGSSKNGLRQIQTTEKQYRVFTKKANYILFADNFRFYYFTVENGKITEWAMSTKGDATPDPTIAPATNML